MIATVATFAVINSLFGSYVGVPQALECMRAPMHPIKRADEHAS